MKTILSILFSAYMLLGNWAYAAEVNINTADAITLSRELVGVGEKKAQAIIEYRTQHGPFKQVEELARVKGISTRTLEKNRHNIQL